MIIFSAFLPGIDLYLAQRYLQAISSEMATPRVKSGNPVHSAPAHTYEKGGGLRGVVNDLL